MELKVYSIRDSKAESFNSPFTQKTHGEAERTFSQLVLDPASQISKFPEDYDLWHLGSYDTNTGKITPLETPQHQVKAVNVLNRN